MSGTKNKRNEVADEALEEKRAARSVPVRMMDRRSRVYLNLSLVGFHSLMRSAGRSSVIRGQFCLLTFLVSDERR